MREKSIKALKNQGFSWLSLFYSPVMVAGGFFIARPSRIVVGGRLRTLGSAHSLLCGVSRRENSHLGYFRLLTEMVFERTLCPLRRVPRQLSQRASLLQFHLDIPNFSWDSIVGATNDPMSKT